MKLRSSDICYTSEQRDNCGVSGFLEASADTYLGCYDEFGNEEVFIRESRTTWSNLAPDGCREECRKELKNSFAGLWGGTHCYCANWLNEALIRQVNNSFCYSPCPGEPAEFCGGSNYTSYIFSVYSVCPRGLYGRNCTDKCNCKDNESCTVHGLCPGNQCAAGWGLNRTIANRERCSIDVDECKAACNSTSTASTNCHKCWSEHPCINTQGSFTCNCSKGFEFDTELCKDVNECEKQTDNCNAGAKCINTEGSYRCEGIDECSQPMANCSHTYTKTNGSYVCGCLEGFELEDDRHSCVVVVERGWYTWLLVAGLGLGIVVLFIIVVALAITVCKLLARINLNTTATASYTGNEVGRESYVYTIGSGPKKFPKAVDQPVEFSVYAEIA